MFGGEAMKIGSDMIRHHLHRLRFDGCLALAQEFRGEDDVLAAHLPAYVLGVAHWDG